MPFGKHTLLPLDDCLYANMPHQRWASPHVFERVCAKHGIEHCLTQINHRSTNGQVERMNRTLKEATVKRFYYKAMSTSNNISRPF